MKKIILLFIILYAFQHSESVAATPEQLVFLRNGDIWIAGANGVDEKRLTFSGNNRNPAISPDGKSIVFTIGHDELTGFGKLYSMTPRC